MLLQATVSDEVREHLQLIEKEQSFEELAVLRKVAMATVKRERDLEEVHTPSLVPRLSARTQTTCPLSEYERKVWRRG